jgi:hypothetical protein
MSVPVPKILRHPGGAAILPIHYSMDPAKDAAWASKTKMRGTDTDWNLEMDIDFMSVVGGRCFDNFNVLANVDHKMEYNPMLPLYLGCDFNVEPMAWEIAQVMPNDEIHFIDEIFESPGSVEESCEIFLNRYGDHYGELYIHGDASGKNRSQQNQTGNYKIMMQRFHGSSFSVRKRVPTRNPSNVNSVKAFNARLRDKHGNPRIKIHAIKCKELLKDLTQVVWNPDGKSIKKVRKREDPYFLRTHCSDAAMSIVYRLWPIKIEDKRKDSEEKKYDKHMRRVRDMRRKKRLIGAFPMPGRNHA